MSRKAFLYRLYPSRTQARLLDATLETCRFFYNDCLSERKTAYEERGESIGKYDQLRQVKERKATNPWAKNVHSHVLQTVVQDLDKAFDAFFRRVKAGETPGYPRFKGRNRWHSFGFKELGNGFKVDGRRLKLSGIGRIAIRWHRPIEGVIKTLRISKKAGKWYASFSCVIDDPTPWDATGTAIGIDVGLASLITTSDGEQVNHPRFYRTAQRKLRVAQRRVARRTKGGKNRRKAVAILQRQHERISNQRKDFLNKLACDLTTRYDKIALEDLAITRMVHGNLAKSILDAGWGYLVQRLTHKAESAGRVVVLVDPRSTSKTCSQCGHVFESLALSDRWIDCACGLSLDRDHNAAINILNRGGQLRWGISSPVGGLPGVPSGPSRRVLTRAECHRCRTAGQLATCFDLRPCE
jgi:putative transposase